MSLQDVVMGEVAKAITASVAGAGIKGTGRLWQLVKRKAAHRPAGMPTNLDEWHDFLDHCAQDNPQLYEQLVLAVADTRPVPDAEDRPVFVPPIPFFDRGPLREGLPQYGIYGFAGLPGCGKTALVRQLAVDHATRFPLFQRVLVNLDEFRAGDVLRVHAVQRLVLRQLGVTDVVASDPELVRQYERILATRRVLLVIENVLGADEVTALVEEWPLALVLLTTRRLTDDLQVCGPRWIELDGLDREGARAMLASRCPEWMLSAESAEVQTLLARFGRQPRAIRVLGSILARRASEPEPVATLLAELEEAGISETHRLLAAVSSGQIAQLPDQVRKAFGLLAVCPAGQFTIATASLLLGCPARPVVDQLRELGLIEVMGAGRFRMSWSIRRFAAESGAPDGSGAALDRLLAHYTARAIAADLAGGARMRYYRIPPVDPWPGDEDRIVWLHNEAEVLAALVEYAYLHGRDDEVGQLCAAMEVLSLHRGEYALCLSAFERGVQAAQRQNALLLLARQYALCGRMATLLHRFEPARAALNAAHEIAAGLADPALTASIWEFTGRLAEEQATTATMPDWRPAVDAFTRAVELDRRDDNADRARGIHARMLANVLIKAGRAEDAGPLLREAIALTTDDRNASRVYAVCAKCDIAQGNFPAARENLGHARRFAEVTGAQQYQIELDDLAAEIEFGEGNYGQARSHWAAIAQAFVDRGHPRSMEFFAKLNRLPPEP